MGMNIVEREGISFSHPARFILVGTIIRRKAIFVRSSSTALPYRWTSPAFAMPGNGY